MPVGAKYKPKDAYKLRELLRFEKVECRDIDFSLIESLNNLFASEEDLLLQDNVYFVDPYDPDLLIWNTSNVTDMSFMFYECKTFNKPIKMDTSKVEKMNEMFYMCENFNQPIYFTDTSNVATFSNMFSGCKNFNQPINFDTSNAYSLSLMFMGCENFNQPINFNVQNAEYLVFMFNNCENLNSEIKLKKIGKNVDKAEIDYLFYGCNNLELENIQLDITDCDKIEGIAIYKKMNKDEFCDFIKDKRKDFIVNEIIDELNNLMF